MITVAFGLLNAAILITSAVIAYIVYQWNDVQKRKDRALELYTSLMTGEFLTRARLVAQEYLLEDPQNPIYN